ncbi:MAG: hypothetical protein WDM76_14375 [Limisphaerales bacterium]
MFRVREGLELARAAGIPLAEIFILYSLSQNLRQELRLRAKLFRLESGIFSNFLDSGKIDMRGEVLLAGIGQQVVADMMLGIGAERAFTRLGGKEFIGGQSVINGQ